MDTSDLDPDLATWGMTSQSANPICLQQVCGGDLVWSPVSSTRLMPHEKSYQMEE